MHAHPDPAPPATGPTHEVRLAVVMYGGISLAIYIHGVAQELLHVVRGTSPAPDADLTPLERVYRQIGRHVGPGGACDTWDVEAEGDAPLRTTVTIDVLSGSSAGGVNAVALAKALATGGGLRHLQQVWIDEGDIETLIHDRGSATPGFALQDPPKSLLNGDRMYRALLQALEAINLPDPPSPRHAPVDAVDLFVTATDVAGIAVPLQLADGIQYERRHRSVFHFRHARRGVGAHDDFAPGNDPLLAFAARATSSIPFAFEPVRLDATARLASAEASLGAWTRFFPDHRADGDDVVKRAFVDGGVLDNKPFGHAIDHLTSRRGRATLERKLFYVEPRPETVDPAESVPDPPNALANAVSGLALPGYETIREDLERVLARNRLIDRVRTLTLGAEEDLEMARAASPTRAEGDLPTGTEASTLFLDDHIAASGLGPAYGGYHRLRVATLTDDLAAIIAAAAGVGDRADEVTAFRRLVGWWRDDTYSRYRDGAKRPESEFLRRFDLSYHLRRLDFVLDQVDAWLHAPALGDLGTGRRLALTRVTGGRAATEQDLARIHAALRPLRSSLGATHEPLQRLESRLRSGAENASDADADGSPAPLIELLRSWSGSDRGRAAHEEALQLLGEPSDDFAPSDVRTPRVIRAALEALARIVEAETQRQERACAALLRADADPEGYGVALIGGSYRDFERFDMIRFPVQRTADIGEELSRVDVARISPADATSIVDERSAGLSKLSGVAFGSFGAFFDRGWREDDILWGRLDGAERLVTTLVANRGMQAALTRRAHAAILDEEFALEADEVTRRLAPDTDDRDRSRPDSGAVPARLAQRLTRQVRSLADLRRALDGDPTQRVRLAEGLAALERALTAWTTLPASPPPAPAVAQRVFAGIAHAAASLRTSTNDARFADLVAPVAEAAEQAATRVPFDLPRADAIVRRAETLRHVLATVAGEAWRDRPERLYATFVAAQAEGVRAGPDPELLARSAARAARVAGRMVVTFERPAWQRRTLRLLAGSASALLGAAAAVAALIQGWGGRRRPEA
jgi:patatin-related protein